jgi:DNA-binding NtrC family response regulator
MGKENTMDDEKTLHDSVASEVYDASQRPFDFIEEGKETALICESDSALREKLSTIFMEGNYLVTNPESAREALKSMMFHVYQLVVVSENFDTEDPDNNSVLKYLESLAMNVRRDIFVVLLSEKLRTNDGMAAFNKSVNLIVNTSNIDDIEEIIKHGIAENEHFYGVFKESMEKLGRM